MTVTDSERLLTVPEVAKRLRVSDETVRRWLRQGRIRGLMLGGTRSGYRVSESELARFLAASARVPASGSDQARE